jgi:hypothetical protein
LRRKSDRATERQGATKQQSNKATNTTKQQTQQATKQQATKWHKKEEQSINGGDRTLDLKRVKLAS